MRIALDTDVVVASARCKSGASRVILTLVEGGHLTALASVSLLLEYEAVLKRAPHLAAANMTLADVDRFIGALASIVEPITPHFLWRPQLRDPNDEMILEAAANGRADAIVTFNLRPFGEIAPRFGIAVVQPGELLRRLKP